MGKPLSPSSKETKIGRFFDFFLNLNRLYDKKTNIGSSKTYPVKLSVPKEYLRFYDYCILINVAIGMTVFAGLTSAFPQLKILFLLLTISLLCLFDRLAIALLFGVFNWETIEDCSFEEETVLLLEKEKEATVLCRKKRLFYICMISPFFYFPLKSYVLIFLFFLLILFLSKRRRRRNDR